MPGLPINGGTIFYEVMGSGQPIVLTPGGRFGLDVPGLRPLAERLARHMQAYVARPENVLPGVPASEIARVTAPTIIFRNGDSDPYHPAEVSYAVHDAIASSQLVEPPWGRDSWFQTKQRQFAGQGNLFDDWVLLAEPLARFAAA